MDRLISAIIGKYLLIFGVIIALLNACANKDVAQKAYQEGDYAKAETIWKRWADAGYGNANLRLAKMAQKDEIKVNNNFIVKQAKEAYAKGEKKAAFILEDIYIKQGNYKKALQWMQKGDLQDSSAQDLNNHLFLLLHALSTFTEQQKLLNQLEQLSQNGNYTAAFKLGTFYQNRDSQFFNIEKSLFYYTIAYKQGDQRAGIKIALIYIYTTKQKEKGVKLLKEIAKNGDPKASLFIGKYLYENLPNILQKEDKKCIACSFNKPIDFYIQKLSLQKLYRLYIEKNIVPWYKDAYEKGEIEGMLALLRLDLQDNNFEQKTYNYSGMQLKEAISYLEGFGEKYFKAKMLLAQFYMKYPQLQKEQLAEQIYYEYMDINRTDAQWHLYQYYKNISPNKQQETQLLKNLLTVDFVPAKLEKIYIDILHNQYTQTEYYTLQHLADEENINALSYLASLVSKKIVKDHNLTTPCHLYKKICILQPLNTANDLKIANAYLTTKNDNNLTKAATIYQFYAQQNNTQAQYALSNIYNILCKKEKRFYWLETAKKLGNKEALYTYDILILEGKSEGNTTKALQHIKKLATTDNLKALKVMGDLYATGKIVEIDPKQALYYYNKLDKFDHTVATLSKIALYQRLNIANKNDKKIILLYKELINEGDETIKIKLAKFYMTNLQYNKAKKLLLSLPLKHYPEAKYLLNKLTSNMYYLHDSAQTNKGYLLLLYAQRYSKEKALLYTFRAALCNTPNSSKNLYELMRLINDSQTIKTIFEEAKQYPKCTNLK